jgi:hypothetical protein
MSPVSRLGRSHADRAKLHRRIQHPGPGEVGEAILPADAAALLAVGRQDYPATALLPVPSAPAR